MIEKGLDPFAKNENGESVIDRAVVSGSVKISKKLLTMGAKLSDSDKLPVLYLLSFTDNIQMVKFLIENKIKANPAKKSAFKDNAFDVAKSDEMRNLLKQFIN